MKKKILLISESLTVQKVVSLTLPKEGYQLFVAKSRSEAIHLVLDHMPDLILVSDTVTDINVSSFPKEVEAWLGLQPHKVAVVLITNEPEGNYRTYQGVLQKPFTPEQLLTVVGSFAPSEGSALPSEGVEGVDDMQLERIFNDTFSDEGALVAETFQENRDDDKDTPTLINIPVQTKGATMDPGHWEEGAKRVSSPGKKDALWDKGTVPVMSAAESMAFKSSLEGQVRQKLEATDIEAVVAKVLENLIPPIVEKIVQSRLDDLLGEKPTYDSQRT